MFEQIIRFTEQIPIVLQFIVTALLGAIPFIESEIGAALGVIAGVPVVVAIIAAIIGNILSVFAVVLGAEKISAWRKRNGQTESSPRSKKVTKAIHKYGIPGASMLGPLVTGTHLLAFIASATGANRRYLMVWQIVAITVWGIAGGALAALGIDVIGARG